MTLWISVTIPWNFYAWYPDGYPLIGFTYRPKKKFSKLLGQLQTGWNNNEKYYRATALKTFKFAGTTSSIGLFGTVEVIGDSIVSFPTDFRAESLDGGIDSNGETVSVNDNGTVQVIAKSGYQIEAVNVIEIGDYLMSGANSTVDVDGWSKVYDWSDLLFGASVQQNLDITGDLTIIDSNTHNWEAATSFDLTGSTWDGINHIGLQLQNNLSACTSADGDIAWIEKKITGGGVDLSIITTVIPVPAAAWLFASGLIGLIGFARRKTS